MAAAPEFRASPEVANCHRRKPSPDPAEWSYSQWAAVAAVAVPVRGRSRVAANYHPRKPSPDPAEWSGSQWAAEAVAAVAVLGAAVYRLAGASCHRRMSSQVLAGPSCIHPTEAAVRAPGLARVRHTSPRDRLKMQTTSRA